MIRTAGFTALVFLGLLAAAAGIWGALALLYAAPHIGSLNAALAAAFALATLATMVALALRRWRWRALIIHLALFVLLLAWWHGIEPSNDRDWHVDMSRLPYVTSEGDMIKVHNIPTSTIAASSITSRPGMTKALICASSKVWMWWRSTGWGRRSHTSSWVLLLH